MGPYVVAVFKYQILVCNAHPQLKKKFWHKKMQVNKVIILTNKNKYNQKIAYNDRK